MGRLVLKLYDTSDPLRAGRLLQQLRRLKATLVGSTIEATGDDAAEIFEFITARLAPRTRARRSPCLIRSIIERQEHVRHLEAVVLLGSALAGRPITHPSQKEESMTKLRRIRPLTLGKFEPEARQLFLLARRLVNGEGPPEELRMPSPVVTVVPNAYEDVPLRNAWGIAGIGVGLEVDRPYPPIEASVVAGYILFGIDWPATFKKLHLPSLEDAYVALEQHFGASRSGCRDADLLTCDRQPLRGKATNRPRKRGNSIPTPRLSSPGADESWPFDGPVRSSRSILEHALPGGRRRTTCDREKMIRDVHDYFVDLAFARV
jgi:hypothetical protein